MFHIFGNPRASFFTLVLASLLISLLGIVPPVHAQNSYKLTDQERAKALQIEANARSSGKTRTRAGNRDEPKVRGLATTAAGLDNKSVITNIVPIGSQGTAKRTRAAGGASGNRRAEITRFDYATGATTRITVDLKTDEVLRVRSNVNYPTRLAPTELKEAKELLIAAVPEISKIVKSSDKSKITFKHLVPVSSTPSAKRYGHRLVWLWIEKPKRTARYIVDLSTREVEKHR